MTSHRQPELRAHTGLRGLAALVVMLEHLKLGYFFPGFDAVRRFLFPGISVDLFFVLSGFILCYVYHAKFRASTQRLRLYRSYLLARFARIYPLHLATMLAVGVLVLIASQRGMISGEYTLLDIPRQLVLVNALPGLGMERTWNYPAWSISIEAFGYIVLFPLTFCFVRIKNGPALLALCLLLAGLNLYMVENAPVPQATTLTSGWIALGRGVCSFLSGGLLYELYRRQHPISSWLQSHAAWVAGSFAIAWLAFGALGISQWWLLLGLPPLVVALTENTGVTARILGGRPLHWLGTISYSSYMLHAIVEKMLNATLYKKPDLLPSGLSQLAGVALIATVLLLSWLSYRFFETPMRKWIRGRAA